MTFAVIKTGGKQYKVAANDVLKIEKLEAEAGDVVTFDQVLMVGDGDDVTVGAPLVEGALVAGQFLSTDKERTVIVFKKNRRHNYRRRNGHRQLLSTVRITEILTGGKKPTTKPDERARARAAAKAEAQSVSSAAVAPKAAKAKPAAEKTAAEKPATEAKAKPAPKSEVKAEKPAAKKPASKSEAAAPEFVDDLKLIGGVGPALEKKLHDAGVTSLKQIAGWKKADVVEFDEKLDFKGRIAREDWVAQAKELVAGKPPRAKADQNAEAAKKPAAKKAAPKADKE